MKSSVEKIEVMEPIIEAELGDMAASVQVYSNQVGPEDPAAHLAMADLLDTEGSLPAARAEYASFLHYSPPGDRDRPRVLRRFPDLAPSR